MHPASICSLGVYATIPQNCYTRHASNVVRTSHSTVDNISGVLGTCFAIMAYVRVDDVEFAFEASFRDCQLLDTPIHLLL
jgi:hypothetical protein